MRNMVLPLAALLFLLGSLSAWAGEGSQVDRNAGFWSEWKELSGTDEWKNLEKATVIARRAPGAKPPLAEDEKAFDGWIEDFLAHEPLPPLPQSVLDRKKDEELDDDLKIWGYVNQLPSVPPKSKEGYDKTLKLIEEIRSAQPETSGLDDAAAYVKGMKAADSVRFGSGLPDSPSPKAEFVLDALTVGDGNWQASIRYLEGMKEVDPDNPYILEALDYTRGIYAYQKNKEREAAVDKSVVDASINDLSQAAQFLVDVNANSVKGAEGAISTVISMRTRPDIRAESQQLVPQEQQQNVRQMVERIPPGRYFSNFLSTQQQPRLSAPAGYDPPASQGAAGCIAR